MKEKEKEKEKKKEKEKGHKNKTNKNSKRITTTNFKSGLGKQFLVTLDCKQ